MVWQGIHIALVGLSVLSDFATSDEYQAMRAQSPRIEFVTLRTDGGAQLGPPVVLPSELLPADRTSRYLPSVSGQKFILPKADSHSSGSPVSLAQLWELAQKNHPLLKVRGAMCVSCTSRNGRPMGSVGTSLSTFTRLDEQRSEVLTRIRRGYFDYLCLLQEDATIESFLVHLQKTTLPAGVFPASGSKAGSRATTAPGGGTIRRADGTLAEADRLSLDVLLGDLNAQRHKTQTSLKATWARLATDIGMPDLPQPSRVADPMQSLPKWTLADVEQQVQQHSSLDRVITEAELARREMMRVRTALLPGAKATNRIAGPDSGPLNPLVRKQAYIREAERAYAQALAMIRTQELKLEGETREAWTRYSLARDNLKRINEESLPRLRARTDLIMQARGDSTQSGDLFQAELALFRSQMEQCRERRELWRAIADLQGLMQVNLEESRK